MVITESTSSSALLQGVHIDRLTGEPRYIGRCANYPLAGLSFSRARSCVIVRLEI